MAAPDATLKDVPAGGMEGPALGDGSSGVRCKPNEHVLVLGDGDLSFSEACSRTMPCRTLVATSFDTYDELCAKYGGDYSQEIVGLLRARGVEVQHGVDATDLARTLLPPPEGGPRALFDRIVFNFPHPGGKGKINLSRALLKDFFRSALGVLHPDGEVVVTLARGQGGSPFDTVRRATCNHWQVVENAAASGLVLTACLPFVPLEGYKSSGHRSTKRSFVTRDGLTHVFCRDALGRRNLCPLAWSHDLSLWILDEAAFDEATLFALVRDIVGEDACPAHKLIDSSRRVPKHAHIATTPTLTHCYTLTYRSASGRALSKERALALQNKLRDNLGAAFGGVVVVR
eukprot:TRINITY_DN22578_c0_g1_i1.p1 TRINITY_DN22578_c0_g1~~TRINITY_DN22578_c0_g1_i1.p1  ORF type:complete len:344 (+),score=46.15 TRINITY_DN22578_c0_g1_i1:57-1088(+)